MISPLGRRIGVYEILSRIGAGGMGEVYRPRDTKLGRDVALKILPPALMTDPNREIRFEHEARILAALNHPNIAAIYDFRGRGLNRLGARRTGAGAGARRRTDARRTPDREGPDADRRTRSVRSHVQVAEALEAAHEKGIVHRDLKPANIKITADGTRQGARFRPREDFARRCGRPLGTLADWPTITSRVHATAGVVGTAAYMSPEQARGQASRQADRHLGVRVRPVTDVGWACGVRARNHVHTIAAILQLEPDWAALPRSTSPAINRLLRRCLQKDRGARLQHMAAASETLRDALDVPFHKPWAALTARLKIATFVLSGVAVVAVISFPTFRDALLQSPAQSPLANVFSPVHRQLTFAGNVGEAAVSPDGRSFAYTSAGRLLVQRFLGWTSGRNRPRRAWG